MRWFLVQYDGSLGAWTPPKGWEGHAAAIQAMDAGCMSMREWDEALGVAMIETCDCCKIDAEWAMEILMPELGIKSWELARSETLASKGVKRG